MSSALNHKKRSRKTYKNRMSAARYYCSNSFTREERLAMMARMRMGWLNLFNKNSVDDANE